MTGSTGALGCEIVNLWARDQIEFILIGRNESKLNQQKSELEKLGRKVHVFVVDLTNSLQLEKACDEIAAKNLIPDLIFNCAGVGLKSVAFEGSIEAQMDMLRINAEALTYLSLRFLAKMVKRGSGSIVNISSAGAFQPSPGVAVYAATKAYVNSLTQALDYECAGTGVKMFTVCPGPFSKASEFAESITRPGLFRKQRTFTTVQMAQLIRDGMDKNQKVIIPGFMNRVLAFFSRHLDIKLVMYFVPLFVKGERLKN